MLDLQNLTLNKVIPILFVFLFVDKNLPRCSNSETVIFRSEPKWIGNSWEWSSDWKSYGKPEWRIARDRGILANPEQYYICDTTPTVQPDVWLRTEHILVGVANRILITIEYTMSNCSYFKAKYNTLFCNDSMDLYLLKSSYKYNHEDHIPDPSTSTGLYIKIGTLNPKVLSAGSISATVDNKETHFYVVDAANRHVYLAFHYQGGCVSLHKVKVEYHRCKAITLPSSLVKLPQTPSPANNSIQVKGSCSAQYTKPLTNESDLYGYCKDDGEWSVDRYRGECGCEDGYGKFVVSGGGSQCRECPLRTYKNTVSNSNCTSCPLNSIQDSNRTSCNCETGFYRTDNQTKFDNCTGQPSAPQKLSIDFLNATFVAMTWSAPSDYGGRSDLYYTVECKRCNDQKTDCTRECTGSDINVYQNSKLANVNSLSAYTYYQFKVYAKNGVSELAEKNNEMAKHSEVTVRTKETIPGSPVVIVKQLSSTSVFLRWEVEEKNGVITYYQVSYYPVDQPSNVKRFNTTFNNATITGLETGKEYHFQVRASSRLGLGEPAGQTKEVGSMNTNNAATFSKSVVLGIVGGVVGALILILVVVIILLYRRRSRHRSYSKERLSPDGIPMDGNRMYVDPSNYGSPMEALMCTAEEIDRQNVELEKNIGGGEFADVYKGQMKTDSGKEVVAVKILKPRSSSKNREDFIREASIMGQFKHPNVIALKGVVTRSSDTPMMIVTEYMANGSLDHYLKSHDGQFTALQLLGVIRGVADGMAYLAGMNFIHRDLAARNILVADNMASKVADFGLSRELDDSEENSDSVYQTQGGKIPVRWTAPEAIRYRKFSSASDVWSFGILMWEIMSFGERPYWDWDNFQVMDRVDSGYRLPAPMGCPKVIHNLMLDCWEGDKTNRPKFAVIVKRAEELIRSPDKLNDGTSRFSDSTAAHTNFGEVSSVEEWLGKIKMAKYVNLFVQAGFLDLEQIKSLSEEDLSKMGVKLIGHRNKINKSIKEMKRHHAKQSGETQC